MIIEKRVEGFVRLGEILRAFSDRQERPEIEYRTAFRILEQALIQTEAENAWFTGNNILTAFRNISAMLDQRKIARFVERYEEKMNCLHEQGTVAVIMAGNIPAVGFHDLFCVMMTRHNFLGKLSSHDTKLLPAIAAVLTEIDPEFGVRIRFTGKKLENFNAVIATGSNNTFRYFEYYFGKYPHILRQNRNGIAVLTGRETKPELEGIADDIFTYFGRGCRSVSKLYLPAGYDPATLGGIVSGYTKLANHHKYANNLTYCKTLFLIDQVPFTDLGPLLLTEDPRFDSPIAVVHYEYYDDFRTLIPKIEAEKDQVQCIVCHDRNLPGSILPGTAQTPEIDDFADGMDTMDFLLSL